MSMMIQAPQSPAPPAASGRDVLSPTEGEPAFVVGQTARESVVPGPAYVNETQP
jgi:hypothetical protein